MTNQTTLRNISILGAILGGLIGVGSFTYSVYKLIAYEKTTGVVTALQVTHGNSGAPGTITFQYITAKNEPMTIHTNISIRDIQRGQSIPVYYNPNKPTRASMYTVTTFWLVPLVSFAITIVLGGIGYCVLKKNQSQKDTSL